MPPICPHVADPMLGLYPGSPRLERRGVGDMGALYPCFKIVYYIILLYLIKPRQRHHTM